MAKKTELAKMKEHRNSNVLITVSITLHDEAMLSKDVNRSLLRGHKAEYLNSVQK